MSEPLLVPTPSTVTGELPDGLLTAFAGYEDALARNDLAALDAWFAPGENTLRGDATGLLVGHDAISGFRGARVGTVARGIRALHVRVLDPRHAVIMSVNTPDAGGAGLVTQLWSRSDDGAWQVEVAQVAAPPAAINATVWRLVGTPLVAASDDAGSGALSGETIAVKDLFDISGFTVGAGNPAYLREAVPATETAPAVAALLGAGASVRGIAQTDEFAYSIAGDNEHYGTPPNVRVPGALPGGSSSGPAAAVALGQASVGLATDTAGSIRVPASYQGLWGLRSTHGAVDRTGLLPLAPSFDTVGWLTRGPGVLRAAAAASLDPASQLPASQPNTPARFAVSRALVFAADDDVQDVFVTGVDRLTRAGLLPAPDLVDVGDLAEVLRIFRTLQSLEAWRANGDWVTAHPGALGIAVASRFEAAARINPADEAEARTALADARARLDAVLDGRILLLPSASSTAPSRRANPAAIDRARTNTLTLTCLAGIGGYPALSVPLFEAQGAPVGLCLVGPRHTDLALVDIGAELAAGN
ncbi:DUF3225 domain-containing protein [Cryobacterium adonitolivorans]|uniref:DUF3225 domain-containing protein n=1 Tax=Cryobacterium adonitolivorans TaxID=1259189 RepID=A0A4R8WHZ5_9MICO|nr:AtzH-like domain-containing protein [Cryobacterium adonitolivorans]TFC07069.1 DUF3225 domain-containing protein [Cryobacterium adonitolivorans]